MRLKLLFIASLSCVAVTFAYNKTGFAYDERCLLHQHGTEVASRVVKIKDTLTNSGLMAKLVPTVPLTNVQPYIKYVHTDAHIASVSAIPNTGTSALAAVEGLLGAVKAVSDGTVKNAFCALRPPGHHAHSYGGEEGFCFYSNVAIAAKYAQNVLGYKKILIIDWDYHHGNGTEDVFYSDSTVLFFSSHNWHSYPGTGDPSRIGTGPGLGYNINVHMDCNTNDSTVINIWKTILVPKVDSFKPDFVLISCGFDSRINDLLGCFKITDSGFIEMTKLAMSMADKHCNGRLVSMLEGGYNVNGVGSAAAAHVSTLLGLENSIETQLADTEKNIPYISFNNLIIPEAFSVESAKLTLIGTNGNRIYEVPINSGKRIPLVHWGLSCGRYFLKIERQNRNNIVLPFVYID
ncbi:MAG: histone deacetylase [Fibrobacteres bacterium]|nr:histone deacetylase [Fibrobacterota bacterium]